MLKFKKWIIGGILGFILCFCCVLIPKADINSVGSELLNDNNIPYYYEFNENTFLNEITSGPGFYVNYLDYLNFSVYAGQLDYIPVYDELGIALDAYIIFAYTIIDYEGNNEWFINAFIGRSYPSNTTDYNYSLIFEYNLPTLGNGQDEFINSDGFNTDSLFYGFISNISPEYNLDLLQLNLLKTVCLNFFTVNNNLLDIELTPSTEFIDTLGSQNAIIKNLFSGLPFTQPIINYNAYFYDFNDILIDTRTVSSDFVWKNVGVVGSNMPTIPDSPPYYFIEWEYSRDYGDLVHNEFLSITQSTEDIYFYPKKVNTTLNGTYTSNGYFTLGLDGQIPIESFNANFTFYSNGYTFTRMKFSFDDNAFYLYYNDLLVAYQSRTSLDFIHWTNLNYSNITFNNSYPSDLNAYYFVNRNFYLGSINFVDIVGYYYFNEFPRGTNSNNNNFRFLFLSNGELFNSLTILSNGTILYDNEMVYNGDTETWVDEKYRLININNTQIEEEQMDILLSNGVFSYFDVNGDYDFSDVLFTVADIPVRIMSQLLDISIFGVSLFTALCGVITIMLVAFVIKKFL